jgi:molybdenum cofactor cytidylyltransferase
MTLTCLLPAAGASSRMRGGDKLMELINAVPCLAVIAQRAKRAGMEVIVTVPSLDHPRAYALRTSDVRLLEVPDASEGMAASLRTGISAVQRHSEGLMILPPDMPAIETDDLVTLIDVFNGNPEHIVQAATHDGISGHPVIFPKRLLFEFARLSGDRGAAKIVDAHRESVVKVKLDGNRARLDLDTPEAWAEWRASLL